MFYKAGFIESWGRGIDKICDGFTEKGFIEPIFAHNSGGVLCTLYRKKTADLFIGNKDVNVGETSESSQKTTQPKLGSELGRIENHTENGTMVGTKNGTMDGSQKSSQKSSQKTTQPKLGSELGSSLKNETELHKDCTKTAQSISDNGTLDGTLALRIISVLKNEPTITIDQLSDKVNIARRTLVRYMNTLQKNNQIKRVGGKRFGHWQIIAQN